MLLKILLSLTFIFNFFTNARCTKTPNLKSKHIDIVSFLNRGKKIKANDSIVQDLFCALNSDECKHLILLTNHKLLEAFFPLK